MDTRSLGGWKIGEFLGEGSTGRVFKARDGSREGALKLLRPPRPLHAHAMEAAFQRIHERLSAIQAVDDSHVVALWDWGRDRGEARLWVAMELLHGAVLSSDTRLSVGQTAAVGRQVATALARCHAASVLHGDLKPQNLYRERGGRVVLIDFALCFEPSQDTALGSPLWMAPECLAGAPTTEASDVYSLGQCMAELVCGRPAFEPKGTGAARLMDLYERKHALDAIDVGADAGPLRHLILECTSRHVHARPTADSVARALQDLGLSDAH